MTIDIICGVICLMMAFLGYRSGAISQVIRIAAALAAFLLSPVVASIIREIWAAETEVAPPMSEAISLGIAAIGIYFAITLAGSLTIRTMRMASKTLSKMDRVIGFILGTLKGALVAYIITSIFVVAQVPIEKRDPADKLHLRDGKLMPFVQANNIILPWQFPVLARFHNMLLFADLVERDSLQATFRNNSSVADLLRKKEVIEMTKDAELISAAKQNYYPISLADSRVRKFLNDKESVQQLRAVDWKTLYETHSKK